MYVRLQEGSRLDVWSFGERLEMERWNRWHPKGWDWVSSVQRGETGWGQSAFERSVGGGEWARPLGPHRLEIKGKRVRRRKRGAPWRCSGLTGMCSWGVIHLSRILLSEKSCLRLWGFSSIWLVFYFIVFILSIKTLLRWMSGFMDSCPILDFWKIIFTSWFYCFSFWGRFISPPNSTHSFFFKFGNWIPNFCRLWLTLLE